MDQAACTSPHDDPRGGVLLQWMQSFSRGRMMRISHIALVGFVCAASVAFADGPATVFRSTHAPALPMRRLPLRCLSMHCSSRRA